MAYRALEVTLLSAKDLKNVNLIMPMEVYAVATISGDPITRQCTPPDPHGGRNPTWNATLRFNVPATAEEARGSCLHILLRAERMFGGDRDVGEVIVPLEEVLTGGGLGAPSSPRFASYQVCKVHRSEMRGLLYLTYRLGPVVPPPPPEKPAGGWPVSGWPVIGYPPAQQVMPSPKPYGYETAPSSKPEGHVTMPPSRKPTDQVVSMTTSPKPVGCVVSMPPSPKPSDQFVSMRSSSKPAEHVVSMPPPSPKPAGRAVPMPPSPKSAGGHVSSPKSAGGHGPSSLKPSVHAVPPSPKPDTSMAVPSSPKPAGGHVAMPSSPKPFGRHASMPPSPAPYGETVGERIFTMTVGERIIQRGAATTPN